MCLIISGPSATIRSTLLDTPGLLESIYDSNKDGLGWMYKNKRGLRVIKQLPKSLEETRQCVDSFPRDDRPLAAHWRMRTHGDIDLDNCHPYTVVPDALALMHNGVLSTGNTGDKTKSDTWHFIKDYLAGLATKYPGLLHEPAYVEILGTAIGNNRFVVMDADGALTVVNRAQGVEVKDLWFSNTYAWDPSILIPTHRGARGRYQSHGWTGVYKGAWQDDYDETLGNWYQTRGAGTALTAKGAEDEAEDEVDIELSSGQLQTLSAMLNDGDEAGLMKWLQTNAELTIDAAMQWMEFSIADSGKGVAEADGSADPLSDAYWQYLCETLDLGDLTGLTIEAETNPAVVAQVLCAQFIRSFVGEDNEVKPVQELAKAAEARPAVPALIKDGYTIRVTSSVNAVDAWDYTICANATGLKATTGYGFPTSEAALQWARDWVTAAAAQRAQPANRVAALLTAPANSEVAATAGAEVLTC